MRERAIYIKRGLVALALNMSIIRMGKNVDCRYAVDDNPSFNLDL